MRAWIWTLDDIDRDCVFQYERLLGRQLKDRDEYREIDGQVDEMILEWETRKEFFDAYPQLLKYSAVQDLENDLSSDLEPEYGVEFVFDEDILISDDRDQLEGYVWAMSSLVDRLKAQEPPLEEDQFMENINFYPVYDVANVSVTLEGHYYLEDAHSAVGKAFSLPLNVEESARLISAFEAYCKKSEGKSCLELLNEVRKEYGMEPLVQNILEYDRETREKLSKLEGLVDVLSPQEAANLFGKPVRDGDDVYLPSEKKASLADQIRQAEAVQVEPVAETAAPEKGIDR